MANEEGVARRFWNGSWADSVFAMYTPFVVLLASGRLKLETFRHYIAQDLHFLTAFAQAYEMAEEYADDDDAKATLCELRKCTLEELKMHDSVVKEWGVDLAKECTSNSATVKYTDFLLATAAGKVEGGKGTGINATPFEKTKIAAYAVGAMTPCMRLYAFLGMELRMLLDPDECNHPYKKWIDSYSSESFEAAAGKIEELLEKLSVSLTGEELEVLQRLYCQAMKLEIDFFSAQPIAQQIVVPLSRVHDTAECHLIVLSDFDLTCTVADSAEILVEIAILTAPKDEQYVLENLNSPKFLADLRSLWDALSGQYLEEYEQCIETILCNEEVEAFNYEGLCKALEQFSNFEECAKSKVNESGVLKGLHLEDIKRAGDYLILQDGCERFFQQIVKRKEELNADVHIVSYCWCGDLIRSVFSSGGLSSLNVHSNELAFKESVSTGEIIMKEASHIDKAQTVKDILKKQGEGGKCLSVYIGDSLGDLLCLLEADVGIVIGSNMNLRRVGGHFGISFIPLFSGLLKKQRELVEGGDSWKGLTGILYTASSWAEIHAFILGP